MTVAKGEKGRTRRVSSTVDEADLDELEKIAAAQDRSVSYVISRAIRYFLEENRRGSQRLLDFERD